MYTASQAPLPTQQHHLTQAGVPGVGGRLLLPSPLLLDLLHRELVRGLTLFQSGSFCRERQVQVLAACVYVEEGTVHAGIHIP